MNILSFTGAIKQVIDMNAIFRDEHQHLDEDAIASQKEFTLSEIEEFFDAVKNKNVLAVADAIGDAFVTASYLDYLLCVSEVEHNTIIDCVANAELTFEDLASEHSLNILAQYTENHRHNNDGIKLYLLMCELRSAVKGDKNGTISQLLYLILNTAERLSHSIKQGNQTLSLSEFILHQVNQSNSSKFPNVIQYNTKEELDQEILAIQERMRVKGEPDGAIKLVVKNDVITFIRESDGKFMKPSTFVEPDLEAVWNDTFFYFGICQQMFNEEQVINEINQIM